MSQGFNTISQSKPNANVRILLSVTKTAEAPDTTPSSVIQSQREQKRDMKY